MISNVAQHKSKNGILAPFWDSALIEKSASGSVASFADGADGMPMVSVLASIEPIQSGTGDPSPDNVRPISGWDSVNVVRTGKNLLDNSIDAFNIVSQNYLQAFIPVDNDTAITMSLIDNDASVNISSFYVGAFASEGDSTSGYTWLVNNGNIINRNSDITGKRYITVFPKTALPAILRRFSIQVELGTTASDFEPYTAQTYPTTLPQTVYGGTLDVVSGVLTITHGILNLATASWATTSWSGYRYDIPDALGVANPSLVSDIMSDTYKASSYTTVQGGTANTICLGGSSANRNRVYVKADSTPSGMLVYPLATLQTIQLSKTEVDSLLANNNVWADSGNIAVTYRADSTLAYEQLTNAIVSLGGNI